MGRDRLWIGLDAGVDTVSVLALDEKGTVIADETLAASGDALLCHLERLAIQGEPIVGIEACSISIPLARRLRAAGFDVRVLETRHLSKFLHIRHNKTDRNDARGIADAIRVALGIVPDVRIKSTECQTLRSELVLRAQLVKSRLAVENALRGVLRLNGGKIPHTFWRAAEPRTASPASQAGAR